MSKAKIIKGAGKVVSDVVKGLAIGVGAGAIHKRIDPDMKEKPKKN